MLLATGPADAPHTLLLAHGAGAPMDSPFMEDMAQGLAARGIRVLRFEFPYMARARAGEKRGGPDRMPVLEACFREVVLAQADPAQLWLGGKSLGGRVATRIADQLGCLGVVALGYPFHPPQKPQQLRTEHLAKLATRCLIVQGTRDPFGTPEEVARYALAPSLELCWVEDGDHSFAPRKKSGRSLAQNMAVAVDAVARFISGRSG
jgi:predicted alpha/beta-hydrolase family hydrolase